MYENRAIANSAADPDDQVRRLGVVWMGIADDMPLRDEALRQAFGDASPMVRYEVVRVHARTRTGPIDDCSLEQSALQDAQQQVKILEDDVLKNFGATEPQ